MFQLVLCSLMVQTPAEPLSLKGHTGWVGGVAFSPDGKTLATCSADGSVKLWDAATGREHHTIAAHEDTVTAVQFSPDGKRIATSSFDGTAKVWDSATRKSIQTFRGHRGAVQTVAFDPRDDRLVATGGIDGTVRVWHSDSGVERRTDPHRSWVNAVAFHPKTFGRMASASSDNTFCFRNAGDGKITTQVHARSAELRCLAFSPNGRWLATGTRYGPVKVWDSETGNEVATLMGHTADVWAVAFSEDSRILASGNGDWDRPGEVRLWDTTTWTETARLKHSGEVLSLAFSPVGRWLAAGSWDGVVKVWNVPAK
jgi:WD40 repeat protein